jgi:hypothetical protein
MAKNKQATNKETAEIYRGIQEDLGQPSLNLAEALASTGGHSVKK